MANRQRGEVSLHAGGETYRLVFNTEALCALEDKAGMPAPKLALVLADPEKVSITMVRTLLWAGLLTHHDLDPKAVSPIIDDAGIALVGEKIGAAMALAFPEAADGQNPPVAAKA